MTHTITLIPGDGIGPEVTARRRHDARGRRPAGRRGSRSPAGAAAVDRARRRRCPPALLDSIRRTKVALKGPVTTPVGGGFTSVNVGLRKALDLFANLRPVWNMPAVPSRYDGVDLVIVRENTEDLYAGLEHEVVPGRRREPEDHHRGRLDPHRAASPSSTRARTSGKRVTAVHKANIMKMSDGLFLDCVRDGRRGLSRHRLRRAHRRRGVHAAGDEPGRSSTCCCCRTCTATSCRTCAPAWSAASAWCRRPTSAPTIGVFEAVHGSAPDIAGKGVANPTGAAALGGADAAAHRRGRDGRPHHEGASTAVLADGRVRTRDLGGTARPRSSPTRSAGRQPGCRAAA